MTKQETEQFIAEQLTQLTQHDDWMKALQLARLFHQYSFTNRLLIWSQCQEATRVAGYKTWQKLGRQVTKGERAIKILAPLTKRLPDPDHPDETVVATVGFRLVPVFDISQTSGEPFPELDPPLLTTDQHTGLLTRLVAASPVPVTFVPEATLEGANGVYRTVEHTIAIGDHLAPDQQLKTLFHELAHHYGVSRPNARTKQEPVRSPGRADGKNAPPNPRPISSLVPWASIPPPTAANTWLHGRTPIPPSSDNSWTPSITGSTPSWPWWIPSLRPTKPPKANEGF